MVPIHCYCITLKGEGSRWKLFSARAKQCAELEVKRFDAVDCRQRLYRRFDVLIATAALEELAELEKQGQREEHHQLTPGAVGCYLSHLGVMRRAYAHQQQRVLIFEDDAMPPPDLMPQLRAQLAQLDEIEPNWDLFVLGFIATQKPLLPKPFRLRRFYRLHAYVVSFAGMAKVLALGFPLRKQLDSALSDWSDRLLIYGASPQLVLNDESVPTTIQMPVTTPPPQAGKRAKHPPNYPPKLGPKLAPRQLIHAHKQAPRPPERSLRVALSSANMQSRTFASIQ